MTAPDIDLDALEAAALAIPPGRWKRRKGFDSDTVEIYRQDRSIKKPFFPGELAVVPTSDKEGKAVAKFIVAANPAVVLELIRRLRAAEGATK